MARLEKPTQLLPDVVQPVTIRPLVPADGAVAAEVFFDAVHCGAVDVYTLEQRLAWACDAPDAAAWMRRFQSLSGFVAVCDGVMVGFMTLDSDGYIDLAFVHSQHAGHGIGRLLYTEVELSAAAKGYCTAHNAGKHKGKTVLCPNGVAARYRAGRREARYRAGQL